MSASEPYSRRYLVTSGLVMAAALILGAVLVATFYQGKDEPMGDISPTPSTIIDVETGEAVVVADGGRPSSIPRPNEGEGPESPAEPGGWQQLALFGLLGASMIFIGVMVFHGTRRARTEKAAWYQAAEEGQEELRRAQKV